ncbi:MAG: hypothetical protein QF415_04250 [Candidatus Undinarchaeales archaeon]|jgi:hypothetical protein|nr:hypothetical protein [Candidatus Undinarchaeales archaeon]MDP7492590.1 hypothetical protein [Candidatus Undinarchaeales archaeon]
MELGDTTFGIGLHHDECYVGAGAVYSEAYQFYQATPVKDGVLLYPHHDPNLEEAYVHGPYKSEFNTGKVESERQLASVFPSASYRNDILSRYSDLVITGGDARHCMANMLEELIENSDRERDIYLVSDAIYDSCKTMDRQLEKQNAAERLFNNGSHYGAFEQLKVRTPIDVYEIDGTVTHIDGERGRPTVRVHVTSIEDVIDR